MNTLRVLLLAGWVGFSPVCAANEKLDWLVAHPVKSDQVDIDVKMDKDSYLPGEIPRISISGYNNTNTPKAMNVLLGVFGSNGTEYDYPGWKINASQPWLASYSIPQNYQLPSTFLTTMEGVPELTPGKWYVSAILQDLGSLNVVSLKVYPFTLQSNSPPTGNDNPTKASQIVPIEQPAGMLGIWDIVDYGSVIIGDILSVGQTDDFAIVFNNGTMTSDMSTYLTEGASVSKAENPKRWGNWRLVGAPFEYRWWKQKFTEPISTFQVMPGTSDQRLDGCFGDIGGGVSSGDASIYNAKGYCFKLDGTFDSSSASSTSIDGVAWGSNQKLSGQYRIDGNFITFLNGNGDAKKTTFGFLNKERTHILIGLSRMMIN